MSTTSEQVRNYRGPALFSYGFRPFFLFGAAWSMVAMVLWLSMLSGSIMLPTTFAPVEWHVHELLYGYVPAVIAGFLLTAVPNWTGRLPVVGKPLLILFLTWLAGRLAVLGSELIGPEIAATTDLAFLALLGAVIAREIIASGNRRNLKVLILIALLFLGNAVFHAQVWLAQFPDFGIRVGVSAIVMLIMLIGGRVVPSFTRNWLAKQPPGRLPVSFRKFDVIAVVVSAIALLSWCLAPEVAPSAMLSALAAVANAWRLARWTGDRSVREPLVIVLHVAFAFIPIGFALVALGILRPDLVTPTGALHAWTAGAIGLMTLAMMSRASLGHTGMPLTASPGVQVVFLASAVSVVARLTAAFGAFREPMLVLSAAAWIAAFGLFVIVFAPLLLRAR